MKIKKLLPRTLLGRSLIILIAPLILVQLVTNFVFLDRHLDSVTKLLSNNIVGMANTLVDLKNSGHGSDFSQMIATSNFEWDYQYILHGKINTSLRSPNSWAESFLIDQLDQKLLYPYTLQQDDQHLILNIQLDDGVMVLRFVRKKLMSKATPLVFFWAIGMSILCLIIAGAFMRNQVKPIKSLAETTESFGKGEPVRDLKITGALEIRQLTKAFNLMRERIERQINQRIEMLAGISHDLRTPLTRMKLELAMLTKGDAQKALETDVNEMESMINEYLDFVRGDNREEPKEINISNLIIDQIRIFKDQKFHVEAQNISNLLIMKIRPHAFKRCLSNLLDNAKRYATKAIVSTEVRDNALYIYIDDNGPGIPQGKYQDIFKPFYRLDTSRNKKTGGVGLGLSIVQDIIHAHGGKILVGESPLNGTRMTICLPF